MPPPLEIDIEDEDYVSEEDSDFAPEEAAAEVDELSASDDEEPANNAVSASIPQKRPAEDDLGSGDEVIIEKAKKRQKKRKSKDGAVADEDEGGEGGLIKTRSMRAVEYVSINKPPCGAYSHC